MYKKIFFILFCLIIFQYSCNESSTTESANEVDYKKFTIVYTTIVNGMSEICTILSDGSGYKKIAEFTDLCFSPIWSFDGSKIIFMKENNPNNEIFVMDTSGSNLQKIGDGIDFICSPVDDKICYTLQIDTSWNGIFAIWEIYLMNMDGSNKIKLTDTKYQKYNLFWSTTDSVIAYTLNDNVTGMFKNICKININNKSNEVLVEGYDSPSITDWSNINNVLFTAEHADIYKLDLNSLLITQLTQNTGGRDERAKISPNGDRIVFDSNRTLNLQIYMMNIDGSNQKKISNSINQNYYAQWSPDGTLIAYLSYSNTGTTKIKIMAQNGNGDKLLKETEGIDTGFDWY